jgi:hypothetical protein
MGGTFLRQRGIRPHVRDARTSTKLHKFHINTVNVAIAEVAFNMYALLGPVALEIFVEGSFRIRAIQSWMASMNDQGCLGW